MPGAAIQPFGYTRVLTVAMAELVETHARSYFYEMRSSLRGTFPRWVARLAAGNGDFCLARASHRHRVRARLVQLAKSPCPDSRAASAEWLAGLHLGMRHGIQREAAWPHKSRPRIAIVAAEAPQRSMVYGDYGTS